MPSLTREPGQKSSIGKGKNVLNTESKSPNKYIKENEFKGNSFNDASERPPMAAVSKTRSKAEQKK